MRRAKDRQQQQKQQQRTDVRMLQEAADARLALELLEVCTQSNRTEQIYDI